MQIPILSDFIACDRRGKCDIKNIDMEDAHVGRWYGLFIVSADSWRDCEENVGCWFGRQTVLGQPKEKMVGPARTDGRNKGLKGSWINRNEGGTDT